MSAATFKKGRPKCGHTLPEVPKGPSEFIKRSRVPTLLPWPSEIREDYP